MNQIQFIIFDKVTNTFHISSECEIDAHCFNDKACVSNGERKVCSDPCENIECLENDDVNNSKS